MHGQASFFHNLGPAQACGSVQSSVGGGGGGGGLNATYVDTVHHVEELLDAVLPMPAFACLNLLGAVLEVFDGFHTLGVLAVLADRRCGLPK